MISSVRFTLLLIGMLGVSFGVLGVSQSIKSVPEDTNCTCASIISCLK